jgi:polyisoprenoid-binding protein YceI
MRVLFSALAMFAVACATPAATQAQPQQAAAQATTYTLDGAHTQVAFSIDRFGFNHVLGRFDTIAGSVNIDQANPERSSVNATIQTTSVSSGNATRDEHLRAERWLNVAQFPTMEYRSTSVRRTGENTAEVTGNLTMHGVTAPVTLNVTLNKIGPSGNGTPSAGFTATGTLLRSTFGMTTGANLIGDEVRITIEALGTAPAAPAN